jgi:hypothetical protein
MQIIDKRVQIVTPSQVIWDFIRDISRNPSWQVDYASVSFITPRREGPGVRWRYTTPTGHECVVEISAWYNRIGYEYHYVDGMPFRENTGRIRLQEVPEGTIVQWTFSYQTSGLFTARRVVKQLELAIEDNLQNLKKQFSQTRGTRAFESKTLMRDAPDVSIREQYKPRHPSLSTVRDSAYTPPRSPILIEPPVASGDAEPVTPIVDKPIRKTGASIYEPPIEQSDTRPRPPVPVQPIKTASRLDESTVPPRLRVPDAPIAEPDFLEDFNAVRETEERAAIDQAIFEPAVSLEDTKPTSAVKPVTDAAPVVTEPPPMEAEKTIETPAAMRTEPKLLAPPEKVIEQVSQLQGETDATPVFVKPESPAKPESAPILHDDTATKSIWEIFGVARPNESVSQPSQNTAQTSNSAETITLSDSQRLVYGDTTTYLIMTGRVGLRARRRRDTSRVRRPS